MIETSDNSASAPEPGEFAYERSDYFYWLRKQEELAAQGSRVLQVLAQTNDRTAVSIGHAACISKGRVHQVLRHLMDERVVSMHPGKNGRAPRFRNEYPR